MWLELKNIFERRGVASQLLLRKKILLMKFKSSTESLSSHFLKLESLVLELKFTGVNMEERNRHRVSSVINDALRIRCYSNGIGNFIKRITDVELR